MYTQCPDCSAAFRVTANDLKQAAGKVRCGGCGSAFDALQFLSEERPQQLTGRASTPRLPELKPDRPSGKLPEAVSPEESIALLKTLDELAGEDIRIEDTGIEWRVLDDQVISGLKTTDADADDPAEQAHQASLSETNDAGAADLASGGSDNEQADELRYDDDTPMPEQDDEAVASAAEEDVGAEDVANANEATSDHQSEPPPENIEGEFDDEGTGDWEEILDEFDNSDTVDETSEDDLQEPHDDKDDAEPGDTDPDSGEDDEAKSADGDRDLGDDSDDKDADGANEDPDQDDDKAVETGDSGDEEEDSEADEDSDQEDDDTVEGDDSDEREDHGADEELDHDDDDAVASGNSDQKKDHGAEEELDHDNGDVIESDDSDDEADGQPDEDLNPLEGEPSSEDAVAGSDAEIPELAELDESSDDDQSIDRPDADTSADDVDRSGQRDRTDVDDAARDAERPADRAHEGEADALADVQEEDVAVESIILEGDTIRSALDDPDDDRGASDGKISYWTPPAPPPPPARSTSSGIGLGFAAALLLLTLGLQLIHYYRETLATLPAVHQLMAPVYRTLGMPLTPDWDVTGWRFEATQGNTDNGDGDLTVYSRIGNTSDKPLPYPLIGVSLTDRFDETVGSRLLEPAEFLTVDSNPRKLVLPGDSFDAVISIAAPDDAATGYKLDVCYRKAGKAGEGQIRCAVGDFRE